MLKTISVLLFIALVLGAFAAYGSHPSTPIIVAKQSFTAQIGAISATTLYTPTADGDFRLSLYIVGTSGTDYACGGFNWTDETQTQHENWACGLVGNAGDGRSTSPVHVTASTPIQFFTSVSGTNVTYDAFVIVEQMD